jgi:hypothetical protein
MVREVVISQPLISPDEETKEGDEGEQGLSPLAVADYTEDEIEEDVNGIDWDFAYNEILKIDERKRDKAKLEQEEALLRERQRIEQEMEAKLEEERRRNMDEVQRMVEEKQRHAEELKLQLEQMKVEKDHMVPAQDDSEKEAMQ